VKKPCTLFSRARPSGAHDASATGRCASITSLTRVDDEHPQPHVGCARDHLEDRIDREEMPAPEEQQQIEIVDLPAIREVRVD
jgi:hypothetical protein